MIETEIKSAIRDIPDFPKPGILFKDITPIFLDPLLCQRIVKEMAAQAAIMKPDVIIGVESRGFFFGLPLSWELGIPFVPVRKKGKLPYNTVEYSYDLEYGSATVEMHSDAIKPNQRVLIHDDLLATGGTANAAASLVKKSGGEVAGFSFLVGLMDLGGEEQLLRHTENFAILASY